MHAQFVSTVMIPHHLRVHVSAVNAVLAACRLFARWRGAMDLARGHTLGADFLTFIFSATPASSEPTFFNFSGGRSSENA